MSRLQAGREADETGFVIRCPLSAARAATCGNISHLVAAVGRWWDHHDLHRSLLMTRPVMNSAITVTLR